MAATYASGRTMTEIEDTLGSPPARHDWGISMEQMQDRSARYGYKISKSPPGEEYMQGEREAAISYQVGVGQNHWVAIDGGDNPLNFTYTDHQGRVEQDVTKEVREAKGEKWYLTRPRLDDGDSDSGSDSGGAPGKGGPGDEDDPMDGSCHSHVDEDEDDDTMDGSYGLSGQGPGSVSGSDSRSPDQGSGSDSDSGSDSPGQISSSESDADSDGSDSGSGQGSGSDSDSSSE
ncbi:hypothetical protein T440DRAFT_483851 [Plenodomus tracheiphilus IPT5]|uniref:Uncharacterized protein n=1 Tax=Plenodomus tracheiphilus IPT5 TaxID=1408161 RepID=A0A6A7AP66_9PLEO|nr:hypothetical protein T440DRAFT_483851 [Plenodomus tracheiphilus IPT5]